MGGSLTKIYLGLNIFSTISRDVRYLGCPLLIGFTILSHLSKAARFRYKVGKSWH